jgi:beta-N-acetylhexosaminidase
MSELARLRRDALAVLQPGFRGTDPPPWLLRRLEEGLESVALFARNVAGPEQLARLTAALRTVNPQVLVAVDEEGGDVTRLEADAGSSWPGNRALGYVDDIGLTRAVAAELGRSLARCGINLDWAPCADVNSDPGNPVIGVRSFGADPELVARHTAAWIEGLGSAGVTACVKHFPGHGDTATDSHHRMPVIDAPLDLLRRRELAPFRAAVAAGAGAVMTAHILVPALESAHPATLSPAVLSLLREETGFTGPVITDGIEMAAVAARYGIAAGSVRAIAAGADAVCVGGGLADAETVDLLQGALVEAARGGRLPAGRLAEAADRVRTLARAARPAGIADGRTPVPDLTVGLDAARRALRVRPGLTPLVDPPLVVRLAASANLAVGAETSWGLDAALRARFPATRVALRGSDDHAGHGTSGLVADVLGEAADRRIVLVVRDAHRHDWMAATAAELVDRRPDTIVVEMGLGPEGSPNTDAAHVLTHGAARVCALAAAEAVCS